MKNGIMVTARGHKKPTLSPLTKKNLEEKAKMGLPKDLVLADFDHTTCAHVPWCLQIFECDSVSEKKSERMNLNG